MSSLLERPKARRSMGEYHLHIWHRRARWGQLSGVMVGHDPDPYFVQSQRYRVSGWLEAVADAGRRANA